VSWIAVTLDFMEGDINTSLDVEMDSIQILSEVPTSLGHGRAYYQKNGGRSGKNELVNDYSRLRH